jgi:S-DNA-T family DNA segregation ATPase FtsK/SpoIIIE
MNSLSDSPSPQVGGPSLLRRGLQYLDELGALLMAALGALTLLGMSNLTRGTLIDLWVRLLRGALGWGALAVALGLLGGAYLLLRRERLQLNGAAWLRLIGIEVFLFACLALLTLLDGLSLPRAEVGEGGGVVGWGIATLLSGVLGTWGRWLVLLPVAALSGYYTFRSLPLGEWVSGLGRRQRIPLTPAAHEPAEEQPIQVLARPRSRPQGTLRPQPLPRQFRKDFKLPEGPAAAAASPRARDPRLPSLDLLGRGEGGQVTAKEVNQTAGLIEKTLAEFGLPARVVDFRSGPAVTQYALEPGTIEQTGPDGAVRRNKVRVSQISGLANDLALALSASALRIEAPVPGKAFVGIEVPNRQAALVRLRPILESTAFQRVGSSLAIALGKDVAGAPVVADLANMPHLLIAGTTGSGKSVCIAALATCLAMNNSPETLRMVMIDPKRVELLRFNGLPHLYGKVETELDRIVVILRWCMREMDARYRLLEEAGARDIQSYNRKISRRRGALPMPRMVVLIDELADLMMMAPDQTERSLVRLAQMARATGIHLVVATQRPSTDILTGLIKANFPARIAFAVASGVDSRVVLDSPGAETLLGRGDMLFLAPEVAAPVRLQGVLVDDQEIARVVDTWKNQPADREPAPWEDFLVRQEALEDRDEILEQAIELVSRVGEASASMLQRRLRIGYPRAARLLDELEELGVVGRPQAGGRTREVLIEDGEDPLEPEPDGPEADGSP